MLTGGNVPSLITQLLDEPGTGVEFEAPPRKPGEQGGLDSGKRGDKEDRPSKLISKIRDIAEDALDYYNDHGEHALYIGFPVLSVPAKDERNGFGTKRVMAPVCLIPISLAVRTGRTGTGITIKVVGTGEDLIVPNPGLMAWLEQQTSGAADEIFADEDGANPWREVSALMELLTKAKVIPSAAFDRTTKIRPIPRTDSLGAEPELLPSAVLGVFPLTNPGLLRDTRWMLENESALGEPVASFLSTEALIATEKPHAEETPRHAAGGIAMETLVTHADPCQAAAVTRARTEPALVIHGPPGTGKSQTIANIIGDHLAHGRRVLFVCDKRTALDVVKYRLDGLGLGHFCGVVHDPERDRKSLYFGLRESLESLASGASSPDRAGELAETNRRLTALHAELSEFHAALSRQADGEQSFHEMTGEWLGLVSSGAISLPLQHAGLKPAMIDAHRAEIIEAIGRAHAASYPENPFTDLLGIDLASWIGADLPALRKTFAKAEELAGVADALTDGEPLDVATPFAVQAGVRARLAALLDEAVKPGLFAALRLCMVERDRARRMNEVHALSSESALLNHPLDRELILSLGATPPSLSEVNLHLASIGRWRDVSSKWTSVFAFTDKAAVNAALKPLGLTRRHPESLDRAGAFYSGIRARLLWADLRQRMGDKSATALDDDTVHLAFREALSLGERIAAETANCEGDPAGEAVAKAVTEIESAVEKLGKALKASSARAKAFADVESALLKTGVFSAEKLHRRLKNKSASHELAAFVGALTARFDTLDELIRFRSNLEEMPPELADGVTQVARLGLDVESSLPTLRFAALTCALRERFRIDPILGRMDGRRVDALFAEYDKRLAEKPELVRAGIAALWGQRRRDRMLARTGGRLNSDAAALRQRLNIRGSKAMSLRRMIAAGGGANDPLYDMLPVWMTSPATVAQIFPREALFDVVIFDEASQCRLEEALPVLLRAKRVVIAGDPRQLPPTRFFEQAIADTEDTEAETAEEIFEEQLSEAEDLLSAALNLSVAESFLDVHYRSANADLIEFSNGQFYHGRLQAVPGHPRARSPRAPIELHRVDGVYEERTNLREAEKAAELVAELLAMPSPPSIGIACFNLNQRDAILEALDMRAAGDRQFAERLELARKRRGRDAFEGLFVKNLENVQGDERDHMIVCTTFGLNKEGKFSRNFGALSRTGGERRLNVLVTRARTKVHLITSIPRTHYLAQDELEPGARPNGRHGLYAYLRYAETLAAVYAKRDDAMETARTDTPPEKIENVCATPSPLTHALAIELLTKYGIGTTAYYGNEGFLMDLTLTHPRLPADVTLGVLTDFNRYPGTPDPIRWESFRNSVFRAQRWDIFRLWSPELFRNGEAKIKSLVQSHAQIASAVPQAPESV